MTYSVARCVLGARSVFLAAFALAVILSNAQADNVPLYTVTALSGFSGSALNDLGQVAGTTNGIPAIWTNSTIITLGALPGTSSTSSVSINDSGQVAGTSWTSNSVAHAFLYSNGTRMDLGTLPGDSGSFANGINNSGQVVGTSNFNIDPVPLHAFLYSNGLMTGLEISSGHFGAYGSAINNSGQVAGSVRIPERAYLYSNGTVTDLGTLPGGHFSDASAINNLGQVAGVSGTSTGADAFLYSKWEHDRPRDPAGRSGQLSQSQFPYRPVSEHHPHGRSGDQQCRSDTGVRQRQQLPVDPCARTRHLAALCWWRSRLHWPARLEGRPPTLIG